MDRKSVEALLQSVSQGGMSVSDACEKLAIMPYQDLGFAKPDLHRGLRQGFPEVIFCPGKTAQQIVEIARKLRETNSIVIATRVEEAQAREVLRLYNKPAFKPYISVAEALADSTASARAVQNAGVNTGHAGDSLATTSSVATSTHGPNGSLGPNAAQGSIASTTFGDLAAAEESRAAHSLLAPDTAVASDQSAPGSGAPLSGSDANAASNYAAAKENAVALLEPPANDCEYLPQPKALVFGELPPIKKGVGSVSVITAGTADIPIAEEVALMIVAAGYPVSCVYDVGVAGVHRLFDSLALLREATVTVVVAGMDGALASFVGGLLDKPVIAVPTSVGYGSSFDGVAALLSMLNSCAAGLTVVNIDNGFGAAMAALRILATTKK